MFDENTTCLYLGSLAMRWLAVRIDALAGNVYALEHKAGLKVSVPIDYQIIALCFMHLPFGLQLRLPCGEL
jgi:hypothetical protein